MVMRSTTKGTVLLAALLAATLTFGCKKKDSTPAPDDDTTLAQDGSDTSFVESDSQLLTTSLVGGSNSSLGLADVGSSELHFDGIGDGAKALFFPRGCLTVTDDSANSIATYEFNGCSSLIGLAKIKGEVKVHYTFDATKNTLTLDLTGSNLTVNRATVDWHATATITANGSARSLHWVAQLSGTTARGRDFSRTNDKTVAWTVGDKCFTLNGTAEGRIKDRDVKTDIKNYRRCGAACPEADGSITITNVMTGASVSLTFDGTANATLTTSKGASTSIPLTCAG